MELEKPNLLSPMAGLSLMAQLAEARNRNAAALQRLQLNLAEKDRQLQLQAANYQSLDNYRKAESVAAVARASVNDAKSQDTERHAQELIQFQSALNDIDAEPGTKDWRAKANIVRTQFPRLMASPDGKRLWGEAETNHRAASGEARQAVTDVTKDYFNNVKAVTGSMAFDPDQWGVAEEKGKMYRA